LGKKHAVALQKHAFTRVKRVTCVAAKRVRLRGSKRGSDFKNGQCASHDPRSSYFAGQNPEFEELTLSENKLEGEISSSLGQCIHLREIDLGVNQFTGECMIHFSQSPTFLTKPFV
jgi:hypothetical protein